MTGLVVKAQCTFIEVLQNGDKVATFTNPERTITAAITFTDPEIAKLIDVGHVIECSTEVEDD